MRAWVVLTSLFVSSNTFNIDTKNVVLHTMPSGYFGYSLDFYNEEKGMPVLVVGAPESESTNPSLRGIRRPGAVFTCSVNKATCREIHVDKKPGNERRLNGSVLAPIENKAYQYFGATVKSNKKHDKLLMCAPKYKYFFSKFEVIEPVGTCFFAENGFSHTEEFAPCRQEPARHGRHRFGYGQCGFSAALPTNYKKGDERVFIGAPGVWYWQGAVFSQNVRNVTDRPNTEYGGKEYDHDMLGYATASGDLDGDGNDDIVAGVPRGNGLAGKLVLYTSRLKMLLNLTDSISPQQGQYCGSSVAVTDLNKDGRDDIITGCPFYTDYVTVKDVKTQERKPQYDVGKVVVFFQTAPGVFDRQEVIVGEDQWGRFGHSLAAVGDLNQDGYNDIVVGAPYAGKNNAGAAYILHGTKDGIRNKYTQKIEGSMLGPRVRTFGFSVAGGVDIDGNGMPDIAVGAWKSGNAAVLTTKPVVTVTGQTDADSVTINVEDKNCDVDSKIGRQSCRNINTCLRYEGRGDTPNSLDFVLSYNLDDHSPEPRAYFLQRDIKADRDISIAKQSKTRDHPNIIERRVRLEKNRLKCFKQRFFASNTMRDKLSPIHWSVNYTYEESKTGRLSGDQLEPAIDTTVPLAFENQINIANNCGKDDVCVPDLKVQAVADREQFLLGTKDNTLLVNVTVQNGGEDSYETKLFFDVPKGFEYGGVVSTDEKAAPSCSPTTEKPDEDGRWTFACELGNPLPQYKTLSTMVRITANEKDPPVKPIEIRAFVNSSNEEEDDTENDNYFTFTIPVDFRNQLTLNGRSNPEQIDFSTRNRTPEDVFDDNEIGPVVSHLYQVSNRGPSVVDAATLDIFWPSFSADGGHLLYIITDPVISDPSKGRCRVKQMQNINPLNLRIVNEHIPTEAPHRIHSKDQDKDEHMMERSEERTQEYKPSDDKGVGGTWVYKEKPQAPIDYEYIPDDEYNEEDDDYDRKGSRVKRETRRRFKQSTARQRADDGIPREKARFSDLRQAVKESKEAGGAIDYHGILSRASVDCNSLRCTHIECDLFNIREDEFVLIEIFSRLYTNTLVDERNPGGEISSLALARVTTTKLNLPHKPTLVTAVTTSLNAVDDEASAAGVPWWLYLLAILIGLVLLALLILLLWRCGFFKRNRPHAEKAQRTENRDPDGHYADTKTRYAGLDTYNSQSHGQML
ncbi:Integrin alpha pat-2 [Parelaphostrongylus tenuis]|uniref:Integrin alpha pat-2 n=1 Tax=Parelaphostrongylus tenuis TaxID=148309 RepID=A0AAD5QVW1_PARTN|nr:Integrin alpha pat-2 [Parelaphostrongylus tenuis]